MNVKRLCRGVIVAAVLSGIACAVILMIRLMREHSLNQGAAIDALLALAVAACFVIAAVTRDFILSGRYHDLQDKVDISRLARSEKPLYFEDPNWPHQY